MPTYIYTCRPITYLLNFCECVFLEIHQKTVVFFGFFNYFYFTNKDNGQLDMDIAIKYQVL